MSEINIKQTEIVNNPTTSDVSSIQHFKRLTAGAGASRFEVSEEGISVGTTTIVDSNGLNSLNNFRSEEIGDIDAFETSSLSYVDVTGGSMAAFTLERTALVLVLLNINGRNKNIIDGKTECSYYCTARIYDSDDAVTKAYVDFHGMFASHFDFGTPDSVAHSVSSGSVSKAIIIGFGAGQHTLKLQLKAVDGGTARISDADIGYVILGI